MPKKPIDSWNKDHSSEVMDYILELVIPAINDIHEKIGKKVSYDDFQNFGANKSDLESVKTMIDSHGNEDDRRNIEVTQSVLSLADKIEKLTIALNVLATKLDNQNVTSLEKDFLITVTNSLK
jgi:hypothetical protein